MRQLFFAILMAIALPLSQAQAQSQSSSDSMPGMDMSHGQSDEMHGMPGMEAGRDDAMRSMESHHMDMGPHMKMTALRPLQPGDQQKADAVVEAARSVMEKYKDYRVALADGYKIFLPNVPQPQYHFTNSWNSWRSRDHFDLSKPSSLLYERDGDGYKIVGVMYTARKGATEDELNARIPLSVAQWHEHVNFCLAPMSQWGAGMQPNPKFGMKGSIATKEACDAAGGRFLPQVFGWMVHVYAFEKNPSDIWSVEGQHGHMD